MTEFFKSIYYMAQFYNKSDLYKNPSIRFNFKSKRDYAHFQMQLKLDWPKDIMPPLDGDLQIFELYGIKIILKCNEL